MSANATFLFINSKGELQPTHPETITKFVSVMVDGFVSLSCHNQVTAKLERAIRKYPGEMRMLEYIERFCGLTRWPSYQTPFQSKKSFRVRTSA
jgi:hypothetical protein